MKIQAGNTACVVLVGALVAVAAKASTPSADAFLVAPVSAREVSLGQATVGSVNDATAFHRNPAGLGYVRSLDAAASYSRVFGSLATHQMVAFALPVTERVTAGAGWVRMGVDDIPVYPSLSSYPTPWERESYARLGSTGSIGFSQNAFFLTLARMHRFNVDFGWQYLTLPVEMPVGVTLKYLTITAGDTASGQGLGLDVGVQSRFSLARALDVPSAGMLNIGVTLVNAGRTKITWDTATRREDVQSMAVRFGAAYEQPLPRINSAVTVAAAKIGDGGAWGVEYSFARQIMLRVGDSGIGEGSFAGGAGFRWRNVDLDYALQRHPLGTSHRVSVQYHH
ncbi:MAG TPA: hypothetical protein PK251_01115 [Candidatus Latescibacteria bacterium]|nr:hypothetical protein [Candidatus Latescibacterota bacterium]HOS63339.1 hypothetical protein [Candidatus Latescibacterota bacterium]HPK74478.1 hypothetical protein [Candidatus Latescibacterota bacterium]